MMKISRAGFTLAEVLTTLMVIGVVAAMTIPTLMNSTDDQQKKVAFKKAMSVLGQGAQLLVAKEVECTVQTSDDLADCMGKVISGTRSNIDKTTTGADLPVIQTADGMAYYFAYKGAEGKDYTRSLSSICGTSTEKFGNNAGDWNGANASCIVMVDINGLNKGTKEFNQINVGTAITSSGAQDGEQVNNNNTPGGSDQMALLLTGDGVRPLYNDQEDSTSADGTTRASNVNAAYEAMYGTGAKPIGDDGD